ncbi:ABC transporter ATP-binding protein [Glutamicibacter uratoxydans]|uniref:ABC transporter ATP-binding protein n=1 Tax=Glutamicibacter uratoxydans TaxID=43667 RepID=A0A4Y4DLS1_GLUUR|nr:ATP-binding cassette domain-containing protein [Glutamicibacter uratoxydans]GED04570.1 ABC transporter ATP-binding protein [Glutamicibacter uratoxydans]
MGLALRNITHNYGDAAGNVLHNVSLEVLSGQMLGLAAPSGAGKSTLLSIAAGLTIPVSGEVQVDAAAERGALTIGYLPQSPRAYADPRLTLAATITAPLSFAQGSLRPRPKRFSRQLATACAQAELDPRLLGRKPDEVSDGQLQRALMARTLITDPLVVIADEPTAQLDYETTKMIFSTLCRRAEQGAAVLVASHDVDTLQEYCTSVVGLDQLGGS